MQCRESFFECVFSSEGNEYQFHFRACSDADAEVHFRERLREYGVRTPGTLLIRNVKGRLVRRSDYTPAAAAEGPQGAARPSP